MGFLLAPGVWLTPGAVSAALAPVELDARTVPWSDVTRLALLGGSFPPAYRPVSAAELVALLSRSEASALAGQAPGLRDDREFGRLEWLLARWRGDGGGVVFPGCPCKAHPPQLRLGGRVLGGSSGLGAPVPTEGGLGRVAGHSLTFEPTAEFAAGAFWSAFAFRVGGRVARAGTDLAADDPDDPLAWPGWDPATGWAEVRDLRFGTDAWQGEVTRALVGARLGRWALSAGWDHRRSGAGLTGSLNLDYGGRPFPALTARRTAPFRWQGVMTHLAPDETLLRVGLLSRRRVTYQDDFGSYVARRRPWFFQWLVGWNVTSWFRTGFTHTVMAVAREGSLWPDLMQVNFPLIGTTWREQESGPVTDRIFAVQFEFRWRRAPWPVLPAQAGRLYWDYGGTDFLPSGPRGVVPQISIPASVIGLELVGTRWDLGLEYAELWHDKVLWYGNGGFIEGYSHAGTLMGHALGGSGEAVTGLIRLRPAGGDLGWTLRGQTATWGIRGLTPGTGARRTVALSARRAPGGGPATRVLWEVSAEWIREEADRGAWLDTPPAGAAATRDWWRLSWKVGL